MNAYRSGINICYLARQYHVSRQRIHKIIQRATGKKKIRELKPCLPLANIMQAYKDGQSIKEIAAWQGVCKTTLQKRLRQLGITFHDRRRVRLFARFSAFVNRYGSVPTTTVIYEQDIALQSRLCEWPGGYRVFVQAWRDHTKSTAQEEVRYTRYRTQRQNRHQRQVVIV